MDKPILDLTISEVLVTQVAIQKRLDYLKEDGNVNVVRELEWLQNTDTKINEYIQKWEEWMKS